MVRGTRGLAMEFGATYRARVIVVKDAKEAAEVRGKIVNSLPGVGTDKPPSVEETVTVYAGQFARWALKIGRAHV